MLSEADIRMEIDEALKNKGWKLSGIDRNVFAERQSDAGRADYLLKPTSRETPLIVIEAKRKGKDLNLALDQAKRYAEEFKAPIAYASDGSTIKTLHLKYMKPLMLNGEEVDQFITETLALQYLHNYEYDTIGKKVIKSRKELIQIFSGANKELRKEGLQAGIERFSEFCNILFLKIFSEEEEAREQAGLKLRIKKEYRWDYFRNKDGDELLSYVNDTVLKYFQKEYSEDIFASLQLNNPKTLKRIINDLDPLSLVDTNSDIKGDAFEYFLKAYLAKQNKDLGEYFTPRHIVKTLVKLVNPRFGETVYDPFCGTGGMLIESFRHIHNKMPINQRNLEILRKETIYGSEITKNARITKMNMILTGDGHNNIKRQDSLKNPSEKKYDVIITNMPFSLGNFEEYSNNYSLGTPNGNNLCIEHCFDAIDSKSSNPRIGIIIPEGILFDRKFTKLRDYIYHNSEVESIVSLPSGAFKPYTDVKTSILYLTKIRQKKEKQKFVWHFSVKNDGHALNTKRQKKEGENDLDIFLSFNNSESEDTLLHIGFNKLEMETIKKNDYISIPNPYKKFEFNSKFETIALGELIEEVTIRNNEDVVVWSVTNDKGFVPSDSRFNEQVASDDTSNYKIVPLNGFAYNPARINIGSIAFNDLQEMGCVSPMYVVFKCKNEKILKPKYLYWLLQSKNLKEQIKLFAFGSVRQTLNFEDFCNMLIPLPSIEEQERVVSELESYGTITENIKQAVKKWRPYFEINKNWEFVKIGDIADINPKKDEIEFEKDTLVSFIPMEDVGISEISVLPKQERILSEVIKGYTYFSDNDLLIAKITPCFENGKMTIARCLKNGIGFGSTEFIVIRANLKMVMIEWIYYCLRNLSFLVEGATIMTGSVGHKRISADFVRCYKIPLPSLDIQQEIVGRLEQEHKMIDSQKEIIKLFEAKIQNKLNSIWQFEEENKINK